MSDSIPSNNNAAAAMKPQNILPMPPPESPENVNGPANVEKSQQAQGGDSAETDYNTKNLLPRLATDALSAASAAVMVAPLITIIDKYVLLTASQCPHSSFAASNLRVKLTFVAEQSCKMPLAKLQSPSL